jgi:hypothetical protein
MGDGVLEAISGLFGVAGVHSKEARATLLNHTTSHLKTNVLIELLNNIMTHFLLTETMDT